MIINHLITFISIILSGAIIFLLDRKAILEKAKQENVSAVKSFLQLKRHWKIIAFYHLLSICIATIRGSEINIINTVFDGAVMLFMITFFTTLIAHRLDKAKSIIEKIVLWWVLIIVF